MWSAITGSTVGGTRTRTRIPFSALSSFFAAVDGLVRPPSPPNVGGGSGSGGGAAV